MAKIRKNITPMELMVLKLQAKEQLAYVLEQIHTTSVFVKAIQIIAISQKSHLLKLDMICSQLFQKKKWIEFLQSFV